MSKTTVRYKDVAPGAENDAIVTTAYAADPSEPALLPTGVSPKPVTSCELNAWILDGTCVPYDTQTLAFWSDLLSERDCSFSNTPTITLTMTKQYSSVGITLVFGGDSWPTTVNIKWYQDDTILANVDFMPDSLSYFCQQKVESYNKIVLTFSAMSLPYRRLKLNHIIFGIYRSFGMTELRSAAITSEMNLASLELPISAMNWTLDSAADVDFMFQLKQPVEVLNDATLIGVYYIDSFTRKASHIYDIECYDAFGVLDENAFGGGVYSSKSAMELLEEILDGDFEIEYDGGVSDTTLTGIIEAGTKREAIQQVLFAWGVCASTDGQHGIRIFSPGTVPTSIGESHTFFGATVDTASIVTKVVVTAHTYTADDSGSVEINGTRYSDTKTTYAISNPDVIATDKQNVIEVSEATLVSPSIGEAVAQRVYDYYLNRNTTKASIVWQRERLGDCVTVPNAWKGTQLGNISRMEIKLSNTVVANLEMIGR